MACLGFPFLTRRTSSDGPPLQARFLNLQEYVSKNMLGENGVSIQRGKPASSADEAEVVAKDVKQWTGKD